MRRKVWSFILMVSLLLVLLPDTVMAARLERDAMVVGETGDPENAAETGEADVTAVDVSLGLEGRGTATDPYRIKDAEQLRIFADMVNGAGSVPNTGLCAALTQNIDLSGVCGADAGSWTPIGTDRNPYTGVFEGGSFTVSGLYFHESNASYAGLFGCNAGIVKNLGVTGADVAAGRYTGSVCGFNLGTITDCYSTGAVKGTRYTGGVCGYNDGSGVVSVCYNTGAVSGSKYVGGICGYNKNETSNCYNMGVVNGSSTSVGGICGYNKKLLSDCYNTGEVSGGGKDYVGSVCGYNHTESTFLNCYYLITGAEKGNYGVAKTQQQFASGEVCWLLNGGKSENIVWYQTCGAGFPAFGGKIVYQMQTYKQSGNTKVVVASYTNDKNKRGMSSQTASAAATDSNDHSEEDADENTAGHVYQEPEWEWKEYKSAKAVFTCQDCGEKLMLDASISKKTTAATCAAEGKTVYTASVERDGETYKDQKTVKSEKTAHQTPKPIKKSPATCEEGGFSRDCWTCPACGKFFEDEQETKEISRSDVVIQALGHKYVPVLPWDWDMGNNPPLATLLLRCENGCGKTEKREGKVTSETTASCTMAGETVYTAIVNVDGTDYEDKRTVSGQPTPHSYGEPDWTWGSDYKTAAATFTCTVCGNIEKKNAAITSETKNSTCIAAGEIKYTAIAELGGREYQDIQRETLPKSDHSYGTPKWVWASDFSSATATFTCINCGNDTDVKATVTHNRTSGTDCKAPGKITHIASVALNGTSYTDTQEEEIPAAHTLTHFDAKSATCEDPGNKEYWECSVCHRWFSDAEGLTEISSIPVIPATRHDFEPVPDDPNLYMCTVCHKKFRVTEEKDGTVTIDSVEDDAVVLQNGEENDNAVSSTGSNGERQGEAEPEKDELPMQSDPEEKQEDSVPGTVDGQDGQIGQDGENAGDSQIGQTEEDIRDGQSESHDGVIDAPENVERKGLIDPEGEEAGTDSVAVDEQDGSVLNLRAESAESGPAQAVRGRQGCPLWVSAAVLAVLAGVVLFFALGRKSN